MKKMVEKDLLERDKGDEVEDLKRAEGLLQQGKTLHKEHQFQKAIKVLEIAKGLAQPSENSLVYLSIVNQLASAYLDTNDLEKTEYLLQLASDLQQYSPPSFNSEIAVTSYLKGRLYIYQTKYEAAQNELLKALKIRGELYGKNNLEIAEIHIVLANLVQKQGNYEEAISLIQQVIQIKQHVFTFENEEIARHYCHLCFFFCRILKLEEAESSILKAAEILNQVTDGQHIYYFEIYLMQGKIQQYKLNYSKALPYFEKALEVARNNYGEQHVHVSTALDELTECYSKLGYIEDALNAIDKSIHISELIFGKESTYTAFAYMTKARLYHHMNDTQSALVFVEKALSIQLVTLGENHHDTAISYLELGRIYVSNKIYEKGIFYLERAISIINPNNFISVAYIYADIISSYLLSEDHSSALTMIDKVMSISKSLSLLPKATASIINTYKIECLYCLEMYEEALHLGLQEINKPHERELSYHCAAYYWVAECFHKLNKFGESIDYCQKALQLIVPSFTKKNWYSLPKKEDFNNVFNIILKTKILATKAYSLQQYYLKYSKNSKDLQASIDTFDFAFQLLYNHRASCINEHNKLEFSDHIEYFSDILIQMLWEFHDLDSNNSYIHRTFEISEKDKAYLLLQSISSSDSTKEHSISKELLSKEKTLTTQLNSLTKQLQSIKQQGTTNNNKLTNELQNNYFNAYVEFETLQKQLETDYPDYYFQKYSTETVSIEALQSTLAENQTVLSYFIGEEKIYLFAITPDEYEVFAMDKPDNWEDLIRRYLQSIKLHQKDSFQQLSFELYQTLLQEAVHHLIDPFEEEVKQVFIIPHAELHYLPFETLLIAEADTSTPYNELDYLLNHCQISYHYSATLLYLDLQKQNNAIAEAAPADFAFTGFAPVYESTSDSQKLAIQQLQNKEEAYATAVNRSEAVRSDGTWMPLPYSKIEVENIVQLFEKQGHKSQQFLYESATKNNLEQQIGKSRFVLIAAHGIVNDDYPELSGLVLADDGGREQEFGISEKSLDVGKLVTNSPSFEKHGDIRNGNEQKTIEDCILNMKEVAMIPMSADLVVLSSCESGIGELHKGEGMMAVNRGFLASGAKNVVSTLFKVNDKASSELTQLLFVHILKGENYSVALQKAKLELLEREKMSPKMWSGFVLFGKGNG